MHSTSAEHDRQIGDDQDYAISRAFFPDRVWFRAAARRQPCCIHFHNAPFTRDQELDALRQELAGWKSSSAYWQRRCGRVELENQDLQRLLDTRPNRNAAPTYRGVQGGHREEK